MSQPEKNKKNAIVSHMSKKRRYKKKYRIKESEKVTAYQANTGDSNIEGRREKDWFTNQYEKLIGKPVARKERSTEEVLRQLQQSTKYRWIPEANNYKSLAPQPGKVHYIEWKEPIAKVCHCPDNDCICNGNMMLPRKKIPHGERYIKSRWIRKLVQPFRRSASQPNENFVQRLAAAVGVETAAYHDLERNGILNIRGAEFCMARCIRYYGPGHMPSSKYIMDKQKLQSYQTPSLNKESDEDDDRICDGSSCNVSTQSTVGPTGDFVIGNYSHVLYSTFTKAIMRDIEGTELQILSYKSDNDDLEHTSPDICSFDKLLNLRELINVKKLKNQISLLKKNIYSSIFEIREKCSTVGVVTEQHEEGHEIKEDSSEVVTIPTPYTGVVIRAKKRPNEIPPDNQPSQFSPNDTKTVGEALSEQLTIKAPEINTISNVSNIQNLEEDNIKAKNTLQVEIDVTNCKSGNEVEIKKQKTSDEHSINFHDSPIRSTCDLNPNQLYKCVSALPIRPIDIIEETVKESFDIKNQADQSEKLADNSKHLKQNNVTLHHFTSEPGELKNIIKKTTEIGIHKKQNNNFVKNGFSVDQLQNMNVQKFVKCLSYDNGVSIHRNKGKANQKGAQVEGNNSFQVIGERKSEENCMQNTSETKLHLRSLSMEEETKIKEQLENSKLLPNCITKQVYSKQIQFESKDANFDQNINTLMAEDNCNKLTYGLNISKEKELIKTLNNNVPLSFLQQTKTYDPYIQSKKIKESTSKHLEPKIDSQSKYKKISKYKESFQQPVCHNIKENLPEDSKMETNISSSLKTDIEKTRLLNKKVSNLSSMLKRILCRKMHKPVKSLPEPSEREMFSIKYSAISERKCSSKFLKSEQGKSYPLVQQAHGTRGPVPVGIRRLTA